MNGSVPGRSRRLRFNLPADYKVGFFFSMLVCHLKEANYLLMSNNPVHYGASMGLRLCFPLIRAFQLEIRISLFTFNFRNDLIA